MGISAGAVLAITAIVASVAAAAASAYAQYQAGQTQAKVFKYQSRVAENQAKAARDAAAVAEQQSRARSDRIRASARARAAASGIEAGEGSPLLVMLDNARQAELEAQLVRYSGEVQGRFYESESKLRTFEGRVARRAANIGAGTTLLSGVAQGASIGAGYYSRQPAPTQPRRYSATEIT